MRKHRVRVLSAKFSVSDFRILPEHSQPRHFYDTYTKEFNEKELNPILLLVQADHSILSRTNINKLYDEGKKRRNHRESMPKELNREAATP